MFYIETMMRLHCIINRTYSYLSTLAPICAKLVTLQECV